MAGGVAATLQPSGDGRDPQIKIRNQGIQQAALAGPGWSAQHRDARRSPQVMPEGGKP